MSRKLGFIFLFISVLSCSNKQELQQNIFRYNEVAAISSLDPAYARNQAMNWICTQLYDGLVALDQNLQVIPSIAKSWSVSDSGKLYRFTLRDDVYFHNNPVFGKEGSRKVVAEDFTFSLSRLTEDEVASPGAWVLNPVDYFLAENDSTFLIALHKPFPAFLGMLSMAYCSVLPFEAFYENDFGRSPVGTGPFTFTSWYENNKLVLAKNSNYFMQEDGVQLPYLDGVAISFVPDKQSAFLKFLLGEIDLVSGLDASYKDELLNFDGQLNPKYADSYQMLKSPYLNTEYLGFSMSSFPEGLDSLQYQYIRQAINYGFDRRAMMKYLRNSVGIPAEKGMVPPGLPMRDLDYGYSYQPIKAKELLAKAGFADRPLKLKLYTNASYLDLCEYIQASLSEIGVQLAIEVSPPSTLREMISTNKAEMFRASWIADYPDAENYLSLFYSKNRAPKGPNYTQFASAEIDSWYELAVKAETDSLRWMYYGKMDSLIMEIAPTIPLYYDEVLRFAPKNIQGLEPNPLNLLDLRRVRKIEE